MCTHSIALCDSCGFSRHMHYDICMFWIWSFREIEWAFETPLESIPKPGDCPFFEGEAKVKIEPGRCPNKECTGHKIRAAQQKREMMNGMTDTRSDGEKIEAQRIRLGFKRVRTQGFRDPLEVGRPHQRKLPVIIMDFKPEEGSGWGRVRRSSQSGQSGQSGQDAGSGEEQVEEHQGGLPIPPVAENLTAPARRNRRFNGPMMVPH